MTRFANQSRAFAALIACMALASGAAAEPAATLPPPALEQIAGGVWIHKSYENLPPYGAVLSQGLVIADADGSILIDTAWNDADTVRLLELIREATGTTPGLAVVSHAHRDKMGGMGALARAGVATAAHAWTNADAPGRSLAPASSSLLDGVETEIRFASRGGHDGEPDDIVVFYPGPGHTRDNIVVYDEGSKVLFGGCLIRPGGAADLGNTADADVSHWADAVRAVAERFPAAEIVIPSHGAAGGRELLAHTIALAEAGAVAEAAANAK